MRIERTLTLIRNKQIALQEVEHTPRRLRKQVDQFKRDIDQVESFILRDNVGLDQAAQAERQEDLEEIRRFADQIATNLARDSDINAKINGFSLRSGFELLRRLLDDVQMELRSNPRLGTADDVAEVEQNLELLQQGLKLQRQRLSRDTYFTPHSTAIAKCLNRLSGLLHRIDSLSHRRASKPWFAAAPRPVANQLRPLVRQIDRAVDRLDRRETAAPELLEETEALVERQLHRYEYWPGLAWIANRCSDITRSRSPHSRVLLGLSSSLIATLTTSLLVITLFSYGSSRGLEDDLVESARLESKRNEALQLLKGNVAELREKEKDLRQNREAREGVTAIATRTRQQSAEAVQQASDSQPSGASDNASEDLPAASASSEPPLVNGSASTVSNLPNLEELRQEERELDNDIRILEAKIDTQLVNINSLTKNIEDAPAAEDNGLNSAPDPAESEEQSDGDSTGESATDTTDKERAKIFSTINQLLENQQISNHLNRILLAAFAGALGSMMSILIRLDQLDDEQLNYPYALGFLKPFIGAVFGVIVFAILSTKVVDVLPAGFNIHEEIATESTTSNPDPLGSIDSQELYTIFVAAFIAGFSERLANDTLKPLVGERN